MAIRLIFITAVWLVVFAARIIQFGGVDPTYRDEGSQALQPLRDSLAQTLDNNLPYPQSAILAGILLGVDKNLPVALKNDLKATSTIHMIVVSGQNLSIVAGFLIGLAGFLGRKKALILSLGLIAFYSILTGFEVPVVRAAIMVSLAYLAQILGRENLSSWRALVFAAALMLAFNPLLLLHDTGFQLSFLATFGVIAVAPIIVKRLSKVPSILREDLGVTIAAQVMVLPVIVYNFGQLSLFGIVANLLILWSIPLVMVSGFLVLALGLIDNLLGTLAGLIPSILLTYFIYIVEFFAKLPGASLQVGESGIVMWVGYYFLIGAVIWVLSRNQGDKLT